MSNIDIRLLRTLLVLIKEGSVSRAAEHLRISQPAASHALSRLRNLFDDPLLVRSRIGMVPTERAKEIECHVQRLLHEYDALTGCVQPFDPLQTQRKFVISAPEYAEHLLMPPLLRYLRIHAPNIRIEVCAPDPGRSYQLLESGEVDLRIAWVPKPPLSLRSLHLFDDRAVCIADCEHPTVRGSLSLAQFLHYPHARPSGIGRAALGLIIDEAVERLGKELAPPFLMQNFLSTPHSIMGSDVLAIMPFALASRFAEKIPIQILELPLRLPKMKYHAYWHERSHKDTAHQWLRGVVSNAVRSLPP